ncbi:DUF4442 domain-containing protein [Leeuwenhoekiella parthenopeia]|uniref:DUF4442 domain-containing protein n=1 Tax=Leeuwenhoekiella parthenopeia TaxID=2890320 RepID=A0ABS8GY99_9FLAO|nr:DUF4442 domain-containing protein [Leeuwenhoekiella parthenopeia]MCC4214645.1 DUF4442 domain-containing protein [Leeuwenhoekiella parthenopeia]
MAVTPGKFNTFLMFKLPSAWLCGVRVRAISATSCTTTVTHRWINQNPFNTMFWAVQGMAAELSTGTMIIDQIRNSGHKISMLVAKNKASFTKKATGKITFVCKDGDKIEKAIRATLETGEGQTFWMQSVGTNKDGVVVSTFDFEWTVRVKN